MARVSAFYGIVVTMYANEHPPPHFHARYGEYEALIVISDGSTYAGWLPRRALRLLRAWRRLHVEELEDAWNLLAADRQPGTIEPLP